MYLEKELQYPAISDLVRIEDDFNRLRVAFMIWVSRVRNVAARISDSRRNDTWVAS